MRRMSFISAKGRCIFTILCAAFLMFGLAGCQKEEKTQSYPWDIVPSERAIPENEGAVTLRITDDSLTAQGAQAVLHNGGDSAIELGEEYFIEIQVEDTWYEIDAVTDWTLTLFTLESGQELELTLDWSSYYGELPPGTYRLAKECEAAGEKFWAVCPFEMTYDFREQSLQDAPEWNEIQTMLRDVPGLDYEGVVKAYRCEPEEFLTFVASPRPVNAILQSGDYAWKILNGVGDDATMSVSAYRVDGAWSYSGSTRMSSGEQRVEHLIDKETRDSLLPEPGRAEEVLLVSITIIQTDLILVDDGETVHVIPYASRPEFLEIKNKTVYTLEAFTDKLEAFMSAN